MQESLKDDEMLFLKLSYFSNQNYVSICKEKEIGRQGDEVSYFPLLYLFIFYGIVHFYFLKEKEAIKVNNVILSFLRGTNIYVCLKCKLI